MSTYICQGLRGREGNKEEQEQCQGRVLAINSRDYTTNYKCESCGRVFDNQIICKVKEDIDELIEKTSKKDFEELENILESNRNTLFTSHSLMLAIKRHLIYIYGRNPELCTGSLLQRKIELCKELLKVYDVVVPGLTKERGLTIYELYMAASQLGQGDEEQLLDLLKEADQCLEHERTGTFEYETRMKIKYMLHYLNKDLLEY